MDKKNKTVLLASDHNGLESKTFLIDRLKSNGYNVIDFGPRDHHSTTKVDYNDYAYAVANAISVNQDLVGVLICGTGIGMSIAANRFPGIRASLVHDVNTAKKTREHNDSNILVLGSWTNCKDEQEEILLTWLEEDFGLGRHNKRVAKLSDPTNNVVLVPGVFEIMHAGHVELLKFAKSLGRVVIALNSDSSAEKVKGRKIKVDQNSRYEVLSNLSLVDEVIIMDDLNAENLIKQTNAKYIVKGGVQGQEAHVKSADHVPDSCEIKLFPFNHKVNSRDLREGFSGKV